MNRRSKARGVRRGRTVVGSRDHHQPLSQASSAWQMVQGLFGEEDTLETEVTSLRAGDVAEAGWHLQALRARPGSAQRSGPVVKRDVISYHVGVARGGSRAPVPAGRVGPQLWGKVALDQGGGGSDGKPSGKDFFLIRKGTQPKRLKMYTRFCD